MGFQNLDLLQAHNSEQSIPQSLWITCWQSLLTLSFAKYFYRSVFSGNVQIFQHYIVNIHISRDSNHKGFLLMIENVLEEFKGKQTLNLYKKFCILGQFHKVVYYILCTRYYKLIRKIRWNVYWWYTINITLHTRESSAILISASFASLTLQITICLQQLPSRAWHLLLK